MLETLKWFKSTVYNNVINGLRMLVMMKFNEPNVESK